MSDAGFSDKHLDRRTACLLFSAPTNAVRERLARSLADAGALLEGCDLGLKMRCADDEDWAQKLLRGAQSLTAPERHDVRIAMVPSYEGATAIHSAIFSTRRLDELLSRLSAAWLRDVLARDAFDIQIQPLIQHPPGRLHGYQCLPHGIDSAGQPISLERMIVAARALDLFATLDERCRLASLNRAAALGLGDAQVFLNLFPSAIYHAYDGLASTLAAVQQHGFRPSQITLSLVNSAPGAVDPDHLTNIVRCARPQGFKIALADIVVGPASLLTITDTRPDYVTLDAALVRRATRSAADGKLASDFAAAARQHGVITIAKGVETDAEMRFVFSAGIRIAQGAFHASPAAEALTESQVKTIVARAKAAYAPHRPTAKAVAPPTPWDISGLYKTLASTAISNARSDRTPPKT